MSGRTSSAALAEVSGGLAEAVARLLWFKHYNKEAGKQLFKKLRSGGSFREISIKLDDYDLNIAVVDGLKGLEKLRNAHTAGRKYDLIEVMACSGGCVNGAGLPYSAVKEEKKVRAKLIYLADDTDALSLPCKSPVLINLYDKLIRENSEISDKKIFYTHFEKRNVLL
jgi:NADH-quinone oxidoreductase subunit G